MFFYPINRPGARGLAACFLGLFLACGCSRAGVPQASAPKSAAPTFAPATEESRDEESALLQPVEVTRAFASRQEEFQACFEREREPSERTKIVVSFLVTGKGNVGGVEPVAESTRNLEVVRCVVSVLEGLKFRETPGGATRILFTIAYSG
jgi:hypothetical protein